MFDKRVNVSIPIQSLPFVNLVAKKEERGKGKEEREKKKEERRKKKEKRNTKDIEWRGVET